MRRANARYLRPRAPSGWVAASRACRIQVVCSVMVSALTRYVGLRQRCDAARAALGNLVGPAPGGGVGRAFVVIGHCLQFAQNVGVA